jgi:uncharacterized membrane protein
MLIIWVSEKFPIIKKIGTVVIAYIFGLILGNSGFLDESAKSVQDLITTITIPLALPLLLMSFNYNNWKDIAGNSIKSLLTGLISVVIIVFIGSFYFRDIIPEFWKVSGLLVGVYSGGTPNLAALKTALNVDENTYILIHSLDLVISSIYLLFFLTIGKFIYNLFLPKYKSLENINENTKVSDIEEYSGILSKQQLLPNIKSLGISILIFAIGGGLSLIVSEKYSMLVAILSITSLGIASSFIKTYKTNKKNFELGMYFILVFSLTISSMAKFSTIEDNFVNFLIMISYVVVGSMILHLILSKIFKIDQDTAIICSVALICSPPFVPVVASALKNKQIIISGLSIGIIGYAIGNYIGIIVAYALK